MILLLSALVTAAPPSSVRPHRPAAARAATDALTITLGEHLYLAEDPVLRGSEAAYGLAFTRPSTWELAGDPVLRLRFSHAPGLDPDRSRLTVRLGDREIGEVALDDANAASGVLDVAIPARSLTDHDRLVIVASQHRTGACDGPFDAELWTRIASDSTLTFPGHRKRVDGSLLSLRTPLLDPLGYGPLTVTPVLAGPLSAGSLDALAELGLAFGRMAEWRGVEINAPVPRVEDAAGPALIFGTIAELPPLDGLVDVGKLGSSDGVVALVPNPGDPSLPVLVVTGRSVEGLRSAARAVARADRAAWLTSPVTIVQGVPDAPPPPPMRRPLPFGDRARVTLADLGQGDFTATGLYAAPLTVPIELEGDVLARPDGAEVEIRYAYGAGLDPALSTLEVRFGGIGLASVRLDRPEGEAEARVTVKVPARLVSPQNRMEIAFHLIPTEWDSCVATPAGHLWGTVFADSNVAIERDHGADLPDLGLLRHRLFPFGGEGDVPVAIELGERADPADVAAALQMVANLGARSVAADPRVSILAGRSSRDGGARILLVRDDLPHPGWLALGGRSGGPRRGGVASVEAIQPADGHGVLVLTAPDGAALRTLVSQLGHDRVLGRLGGSRVVVGEGGEVAVVEQAARRRVWRSEGLALLRLRAQEESTTLVAGLLPGALAMAAALRGWARRRGGVTG